MSASPDMGPVLLPDGDTLPPPPASMLTAVLDLISSRLALMRLESKEVLSQWVKSALLFVIAAFLAVCAWALILAGLVSWIATAAGWSWHWVALGMGAGHLILAWVLTQLAKPAQNTPFPLTRSEFKKDRQWIENLQKPRKPSA